MMKRAEFLKRTLGGLVAGFLAPKLVEAETVDVGPGRAMPAAVKCSVCSDRGTVDRAFYRTPFEGLVGRTDSGYLPDHQTGTFEQVTMPCPACGYEDNALGELTRARDEFEAMENCTADAFCCTPETLEELTGSPPAKGWGMQVTEVWVGGGRGNGRLRWLRPGIPLPYGLRFQILGWRDIRGVRTATEGARRYDYLTRTSGMKLTGITSS